MKFILFFFLFFIQNYSFANYFDIKAPYNNAVYLDSDTSINLIWNYNTQQNSIFFIELSTFNDFSIVSTFTSSSNSYLLNIQSLLANVYYWRVRTSSDTSLTKSFTIININNIGNLAYHINSQSNVYTTNNKVTSWNNLANSQNNASQTIANIQPDFISKLINGQNMVKFGGVNGSTKTRLSLNRFKITDNNFTLISAYKQISLNSTLSYVLGDFNPKGCLFSGGAFAGGRNFGVYDGASVKRIAGTTNLNWGIRSAIFNKLYYNGVEATNTIGTQIDSLHFNTIGLRPDVLSLNFHGYLGDVIIYNEVLSDSLRVLVENYIKTKYTPIPNFGNDTSICAIEHTLKTPSDHGYSQIIWSNGQSNIDSIIVTSSGTYWVEVKSFGITLTDTIIIELEDKPFLNLTEDTVSCVNNGLFLTYTPVGLYEYTWSNSSTADSLFSLQTGDYYISQTDTATLCVINSEIIHVEIDSFTLQSTLGNDRIFCLGSYLNFETTSSGNEPYIYNWSTNDTSSFVVLNTVSDTTIFLEAIDAYSCKVFDTINAHVINLASPNIDFISDTVCFGNSSSFTSISSANGLDQINGYSWTFPNNSSTTSSSTNFTHNIEQTYQVTHTIFTDSNCENSITKDVFIHKLPEVLLSNQVVCENSSNAFSFTSSAFPPDNISAYHWYKDNVFISSVENEFFTFTNQNTQNIKLQVTTDFGCENSDEITIEVFPQLSADFSYTKNCLGDSVAFIDETQSLSVVDWNWSFSAFSNSNLQNPKFVYNTIGSQDITLDIENAIGCKSTITKTINISPQPIASFAFDKACPNNSSLFFDNSILVQDSITNFSWKIETTIYSTDSIKHLFVEEDIFDLEFAIETKNGCKDDTIYSITVNPLPNPSFTFSPNYGTAPLEVNFTNETLDATLYNWSFGNNENNNEENPSHTFTENGIYNISLQATNEFNCDATITQQISIIPSDLDIELKNLDFEIIENTNNTISIKPSVWLSNVGSRKIENTDLVLRLNNGTQIAQHWSGSLGIGKIIDYTFDSYFLVENLVYSNYICVEAINVNDHTEINFSNNKACKLLKGLVQFSEPYPNPANQFVYIDIITKNKGKCEIEVVDMLGNQVSKKQNIQLVEAYNQLQIETNKYQAGKYLVKIRYLNDIYMKSFVIE